jgi:hypothetical protein
MNWMQFLPIAIILAVGFAVVWLASGKKSGCGCSSACAHDHPDGKKKEDAAR